MIGLCLADKGVGSFINSVMHTYSVTVAFFAPAVHTKLHKMADTREGGGMLFASSVTSICEAVCL